MFSERADGRVARAVVVVVRAAVVRFRFSAAEDFGSESLWGSAASGVSAARRGLPSDRFAFVVGGLGLPVDRFGLPVDRFGADFFLPGEL